MHILKKNKFVIPTSQICLYDRILHFFFQNSWYIISNICLYVKYKWRDWSTWIESYKLNCWVIISYFLIIYNFTILWNIVSFGSIYLFWSIFMFWSILLYNQFDVCPFLVLSLYYNLYEFNIPWYKAWFK